MQENDQRRGESARPLKSAFCWSLHHAHSRSFQQISECDLLSHPKRVAGAVPMRKMATEWTGGSVQNSLRKIALGMTARGNFSANASD